MPTVNGVRVDGWSDEQISALRAESPGQSYDLPPDVPLAPNIMLLGMRVEAAVAQMKMDLAKPRVYVIGALKNDNVPVVAQAIRDSGAEVFDSWHGAGPDADTYWREYEQAKGNGYLVALDEPLAVKNFGFDAEWLDWSNVGVLVLPAGISGHLEIASLTKQTPHKRTFVLMEEEPEGRWDLMYKMVDRVFVDLDALIEEIGISR